VTHRRHQAVAKSKTEIVTNHAIAIGATILYEGHFSTASFWRRRGVKVLIER
jgi:hypothetical protein